MNWLTVNKTKVLLPQV